MVHTPACSARLSLWGTDSLVYAAYGTHTTRRDGAVVQSGDAHLVSLDGGDLYATSRTFNARPVLSEVYSEDGTRVQLTARRVHPPCAPHRPTERDCACAWRAQARWARTTPRW
jgi:hypothetical protein